MNKELQPTANIAGVATGTATLTTVAEQPA